MCVLVCCVDCGKALWLSCTGGVGSTVGLFKMVLGVAASYYVPDFAHILELVELSLWWIGLCGV
jgi:hypothetical protein